MFKKAVHRGRSELRGSSYSAPYDEPLSDARTKLAGFFNILLGSHQRHDAQTHQQVVDRMAQNPRPQTAGLFVGPGPNHPAPKDAEESDPPIAVREGEQG